MGCPAFEDNIAGVVSLGDDANERFAVHHDQRSDLILGHFRDGIEYGRIRMNGADFSTLLIQQLSYRNHLRRPCTLRGATGSFEPVNSAKSRLKSLQKEFGRSFRAALI
jgi:hypothetical protein